jgi:hypothetical protein
LRSFAQRTRPDLALSHNSYAQLAAARSLDIPSVTAMDFEHQPSNHLAFRLADVILLPEAIAADDVRRQGATRAKIRFYPGYKEDLYLGGFEPDPRILERLGIDRGPGTVVAVTRTPPTRALYHRHENKLYVAALRNLASQPQVSCIALVRHAEQRSALAQLGLANIVLPDRALDARSLMYAADLVLGGGGTMTREAALLGIPTYSVFAGRQPAVDRALERNGSLRRVTDCTQLSGVTQRKQPPTSIRDLRSRSEGGISAFVTATEELSSARSRARA